MSSGDSNLSADEIALYDRQIRLWGMAAQARMRSAKVLLINLGSIGTEITKNIVLSGIGNLTLLDDHTVTEEDLGSQFFLSKENVGYKRLEVTKDRIQELNPRVNLTYDVGKFKEKDAEYFKQFDLIIGTELSTLETIELNKITRRFNIPLYIAGSNGLFAYIFVDLVQFDAVDEKLKSSVPVEIGRISSNKEVIEVNVRIDEDDSKKIYEKVTTRHHYKTFEDVLQAASLKDKLNRRQLKRLSGAVPLTFAKFNLQNNQACPTSEELRKSMQAISNKFGVPVENIKDEYFEQFANQSGIEFAPVSAVIGGAVAQDVINVFGKRQSPICNFIIFDGITLDMPIYEF
ncbi:hypothetical protein Kpol_1050p106 [Vanderwaltozyma polyspora DSM 70294]|uniref:Ubiquitin-like 1-activating enzyme E1A n=1 Tax=Vanderwaltozyma polyspora (strain ATCC 22028 / DSM 70294 / BCRC 21397 / CBS 2163 / NBRC 10782 / NRRL Y-8283 / UCD 57-17) TaxID=436907 RepID=A7TF00_VANPO|nr:uncharacterized protein Kpol_1050p106 [Vanderwaltozyma polyspora DSM 70294]EDO19246.1 hypothetical protein Kpol_1050p106 [Vanderwaltozyma polyspora DSM 70294]